MEKPRVLVADDNESTCALIRALLQHDFQVELASHGQEAIDMLRNRQYAVVLLDLLMPVADGFAVLDFVKSERPDLLRHVVVVTAALSARDMDRLRSYNIYAFIAKPFEVSELHSVTRACAGLGGGENHSRGPLLSGSMFLLLAADLLRHVR